MRGPAPVCLACRKPSLVRSDRGWLGRVASTLFFHPVRCRTCHHRGWMAALRPPPYAVKTRPGTSEPSPVPDLSRFGGEQPETDDAPRWVVPALGMLILAGLAAAVAIGSGVMTRGDGGSSAPPPVTANPVPARTVRPEFVAKPVRAELEQLPLPRPAWDAVLAAGKPLAASVRDLDTLLEARRKGERGVVDAMVGRGLATVPDLPISVKVVSRTGRTAVIRPIEGRFGYQTWVVLVSDLE